MKAPKLIVLLYLFTGLMVYAQKVKPPEPFGALPSKEQVAWQKLEYYMFIHFGPNTFTDKEWGHGTEDPKVFNPSQLDARQWVRIAKAAGMKGIIITAKHHDGFCLWPSKYSTHTVRESAWKNGKGDVLRELSDACKEADLKFGVYLSPWDRNHPAYGKPEYNQVFANTLNEVLTNYGQVFEQWFDGANGEGANGKKQEYNWPLFHQTVYKNQPQAIIFSDIGPGCRWVGNENGFAGTTNWSTLNTTGFGVGTLAPPTPILNTGNEGGEKWIPAECDVSIRPGWFYSPQTDDKVKSVNNLLEIYYKSVGRNANLLLNVPVDKRGLIHPADSARLMEFRNVLDVTFKNNLAKGKKVTATNTRGSGKIYAAQNLTDGNYETYWVTNDNVKEATITINLGKPTEINRVLLQEYISLGQRVKAFKVDYWDGKSFKEIDKQTTIGYKRILTFPDITTSQIRVTILEAKAPPVLSELQVYKAPEQLATFSILRDKNGLVTIKTAGINPYVTYTTDGTEPTIKSKRFEKPFELAGAGTVKAKSFIPATNKASETITENFDIAPKNWKVIATSNETKGFEAARAIDANPNTYWHTDTNAGKTDYPHELIIDLGETLKLQGFTYLPHQDNHASNHPEKSGIVYRYNFLVSADGKNWRQVITNGTFANIKNNPIRQVVRFNEQQPAKFIKLQSLSSVNDKEKSTSAAEIGIITQ